MHACTEWKKCKSCFGSTFACVFFSYWQNLVVCPHWPGLPFCTLANSAMLSNAPSCQLRLAERAATYFPIGLKCRHYRIWQYGRIQHCREWHPCSFLFSILFHTRQICYAIAFVVFFSVQQHLFWFESYTEIFTHTSTTLKTQFLRLTRFLFFFYMW